MKRTISILAGVLLGAASAFGQATTSPSPQTVVIAPDNATKVLIAPFKQVGDTNSQTWVAAAVQEDLITASNQDYLVRAQYTDHKWANSEIGDALNSARQQKAGIVVFGSYQVNSDQLRFNGEAADVNSGKVIATLGATGNLQDLFKMEDTLAAQLQSVLPNPNPSAVYTSPSTAMPQDVTQYNNVVTTTPAPYQVPDYTPGTYAYSPPVYDYPTYGYYPGYYSGYPFIVFNSGFGRGFHRDFDHRDFDHRGTFVNRGFNAGIGIRSGVGITARGGAGVHFGVSTGRSFGGARGFSGGGGHSFGGGHR